MTRILFIGHSAGLTGAPIMLLHLLCWLRANTDWYFEVLLSSGGELELQYAAVAPTWHLHGHRVVEQAGTHRRISHDPLRTLDIEDPSCKASLLSHFRNQSFDLIYSNTITNGEVLDWLEPLGVPAVSHVHELRFWIKSCGPANLESVRKHSIAFIAASQAVKRELVQEWAFPHNRIEVVHEFIPTGLVHSSLGSREKLRRSLNFPLDAFLIVGSGLETWRKGKDIFIELADSVRKIGIAERCRFLWVGGWENQNDRDSIYELLERKDLSGLVEFVGQVTNPYDYFAAADMFAMVSREDPFPLVCLEAAALGVPIVCFKDAGGMPEFVETDAGFVVPYLDVDAMVLCVSSLMQETQLGKRLGEHARKKVCLRHDVGIGAQKIRDFIMSLRNTRGNS